MNIRVETFALVTLQINDFSALQNSTHCFETWIYYFLHGDESELNYSSSADYASIRWHHFSSQTIEIQRHLTDANTMISVKFRFLFQFPSICMNKSEHVLRYDQMIYNNFGQNHSPEFSSFSYEFCIHAVMVEFLWMKYEKPFTIFAAIKTRCFSLAHCSSLIDFRFS